MLPSESAQKRSALISQYSPKVQKQIALLSRKMIVFGMPALFTRLVEGPVVRTFYFEPQGDATFSSVLNKGDELAGALAVDSVRVERVLGECAISVPREDRQTIEFDKCLHTMLTSPETKNMSLPLLMGTSTDGTHLYADLAAQPHLLIAGTTGSGKSVFTAQLICSLALFRSPEELEFILVDTKNLDLVFFRTLEHTKYVLTNIEDLRTALTMLLEEVRDRNNQMSGVARNITEWNALRTGKRMIHKVLIVDELADVFMQDWDYLKQFKKAERPPAIEDLIMQISQISRAAGVHLILATQRPSVDVLPGRIKANFPARVGFKLPTQADSRVILDENGAEKMLGKGDYLYKIAGSDVMKRAHSAFVSTNDIANILMQNEEIRRTYVQC
ncbi:MAG: DNA translocase FtsK [Sulfuriferula sp.]|nr:DNA translocase FtsK [Sulfuriferula sp.]